MPSRRDDLRLARGPFRSARRHSRHKLLREVLGESSGDGDDTWCSFAVFDHDECIGNIDVGRLVLATDGSATPCSGLRAVAVDPAWRGRGLFRDLMEAAIEVATPPTLLYTETPALYERFGFAPLPQHATVGPAPAPHGTPRSRPLALDDTADRAIIARLWPGRQTIATRCALQIDLPLFLANLGKASFQIAHVAEPEAVVVFETQADTFVLVDMIASHIPDLATLLGALGLAPRRVEVLFPPDRLRWSGRSRTEDTGLMSRGPLPDGLAGPFMFPPTVEF